MSEPLALKYRPTSFSEMVGQKINAVVLQQMVETNSVPFGLLFSGVSGSGKTTAARILANALDGSDVIEVDAASHGSVADVREMIESLKYSAGGNSRVVIYDEAHSMSREAFNALLKTLEEPPSGTYFVLVTTEPEKIPETVKGRLIEFSFTALTPSEIYDRLVFVSLEEDISISDELLAFLAERAEGSMRDALQLLDLVHRASITGVDQFRAMTGESDVAPEVVSALVSGDPARIFSQVEVAMQRMPDPSHISAAVVQCLKELLILRAGGQIKHSGDRLTLRHELTLQLEPERILAALKILWDLRTKVRNSSDPRGNLDLALILVSEIFTRGKQAPVQAPVPAPRPTPAPEQPKRLTLSEL